MGIKTACLPLQGHEWELFQDFYATQNASLPVTQIMVEFHSRVRGVAPVFHVIDKLLADNFRVFSLEPNYYCDNGCCARDHVEFALIKVSPNGQICSPHSYEAAGKEFLPHGCRGAIR